MMIPSRLAEMHTRWLTDVLRGARAISDSMVVAAHYEPVGVGVGTLRALTRVELTYDHTEPGAPAAVIIKLTSPHRARWAQSVALGLDEAEGRFYNELATPTSARFPRCFLAEFDPATSNFAIVMEDLTGCATPDQLDGIDWVASVVDERIESCSAA